MDFPVHASAAARRAFGRLGQKATLAPAVGGSLPVTVVLSRQAVAVGEFGQEIEMRDTLSFLLSEAAPARGDTVTIGADSYRLDTVSDDDGIVRKLFALKLVPQAAYLVTADGERLVTADGDYLMAA